MRAVAASGTTLAFTLFFLAAQPAMSQSGGKPLPAVARVRSEINLFLELHSYLRYAERSPEDELPDYKSELAAYRQARESVKDHAVWQIINDACVMGPDITAIRKRAESLPANLSGPDREAARKMLEALATAWPRFQAREMVDHNRSLQTVMVKTLRKSFSGQVEERIMTTLYEKMHFQPLDAPITVYPVVESVEAGAWGRTPKGYYIVLPVARRPGMMIIESLVHELTHLIDGNQPAGSHTFLKKLRDKAAGADQQTVEAFLHGLVAWNAGEMIRRFVSKTYTPLADISSDLRASIQSYLPTYEGPWVAYLEGKIPAGEAIAGMAAALKPAAAVSTTSRR